VACIIAMIGHSLQSGLSRGQVPKGSLTARQAQGMLNKETNDLLLRPSGLDSKKMYFFGETPRRFASAETGSLDRVWVFIRRFSDQLPKKLPG
jgi:hypothetical protein